MNRLNNHSAKLLTILILLVFSTGCLKTRSEMRQAMGKKERKEKTEAQQKAEQQMEIEALGTQMRELIGRVEVLENKVARLTEKDMEVDQKKLEDVGKMKDRMKIFEEALVELDKKIQRLESK